MWFFYAHMNNVHPTIRAAINPFIKRLPATQGFFYTLNGVDLACELSYEKAEKQTRDEPGWTATATLESVHTNEGRIDVIGLISKDQITEIETAFLNQKESF